jgi:anthranilate synthase component 1
VLRRALSGHKPARLPGLPPFTAGAVGFFSYDAVRQIERLPELAKDELGVPDACLLFFDEVLAFDHVRKEIWLVVTADVTRGKPADAYDKAVAAARQAGKAPGPAAAQAARSKPRASSR